MIAMISVAGATLLGLIVTIFFAGFSVIGSQMTLGALSATLYPTRIRATGSSWAFGVARLLSIVGPLLGGFMIERHWPLAMIFYCAAVPLVFAMISMLAMMRTKQSATRDENASVQTSRVVS
jgi:AAHS family 4-hydroxybenzoate transporter-like MFS transporter